MNLSNLSIKNESKVQSIFYQSGNAREKLPPDTKCRPAIKSKFGRQVAELLELDIVSGPWLAGGMLLVEYQEADRKNSDWDIWFASEEQFFQAVEKIAKLSSVFSFNESTNAVTVRIKDTESQADQLVQLIRRQYFNSPAEIIDYFDFTICKLVTDGKELVFHENAFDDVEGKVLKVDGPLRAGLGTRIVKYISRGYSVSPELKDEMFRTENDYIWEDVNEDYD